MDEIILSEEDLKLTHELALINKVANYYMYPERTSCDEKIILNEAIRKNKDIHYKALELVRKRFRKKYRGRGK